MNKPKTLHLLLSGNLFSHIDKLTYVPVNVFLFIIERSIYQTLLSGSGCFHDC